MKCSVKCDNENMQVLAVVLVAPCCQMILQDCYYDTSAAQEGNPSPQDVTFAVPFSHMHKIITLTCVAGIEDILFGYTQGVFLCKPASSLQVE